MAVASTDSALAEKRILIIEADGTLSDEWANGLRDYGFKVAVTNDGDDGMVKAEKAPPDLVMLRVELPSVNGYKIAKRLKEHEQLKDVPLLLLSSEASEKDFDAHKKTKSRAQGYRKVPVGFDDLLEDVENLVGLPVPQMAEFQAEAVPHDVHVELEQKHTELLLQIDKLKEQLETKTLSEKRLEARLAELEHDLSSKAGAGAAVEALTSELQSLRNEVTAVKGERDESRDELDGKKRIVAKLKENITRFETQMAEGAGKARELEARVTELNARVADLSQRPTVDHAPRVSALEEELSDTRGEIESKKKVISKLKENIEKLEAAQTNNEFIEQARKEKEDALRELEDARGDVEAKKKVISTLKTKIETLEKEYEKSSADVLRLTDEKAKIEERLEDQKTSLEAAIKTQREDLTEAANTAKAEIEEELEAKKKTVSKLKERVEELEREIAAAKKERDDNDARLTRTIANITVSVNDAKEKQTEAEERLQEAVEAKAGLEKQHQKELDALKGLYEPKVAMLKQVEKELDSAKENIRGLDRKLDEEARKNRERDDEYADKISELKRTQGKEMAEASRREDDLKKELVLLSAENKKNEERVVKAFKKLKAHEEQTEKVKKALEIAATLASSGEQKVAKKPTKVTSEPE